MDLKPNEVLALTHREFYLIAEENKEKIHDRNEREAMYAIFYAAAYRGKGKQGKLPTVKDLYDRNKLADNNGDSSEDPIKSVAEKQEHMEKWLEQFDLNAIGLGKNGEKGGN